MSTAVITSQLLKLQDLDYGTNQKIPSQLIVTSVINNAFAIIINNLVWTKGEIPLVDKYTCIMPGLVALKVKY